MIVRSFAALTVSTLLLAHAPLAHAQLSLVSSFSPSNNADPCGTAVDAATGNVQVYDCFGANLVQNTAAGFFVSHGDLDVAINRNLRLVSSDEATVAELTRAGALVRELAYSSGVPSISGIAVSGCVGEGWVSGSGGLLWRLAGLRERSIASCCTAGTSTNGCAATLGVAGT